MGGERGGYNVRVGRSSSISTRVAGWLVAGGNGRLGNNREHRYRLDSAVPYASLHAVSYSVLGSHYTLRAISSCSLTYYVRVWVPSVQVSRNSECVILQKPRK